MGNVVTADLLLSAFCTFLALFVGKQTGKYVRYDVLMEQAVPFRQSRQKNSLMIDENLNLKIQ